MMTVFGTPLSAGAKRVLLLGSGELGKEVVIELQRYGVETIAVDRYANAPAMQLAHRSHVIDMLDGAEIRRVIELEQPDLIVPEIETIHPPTLQALERESSEEPTSELQSRMRISYAVFCLTKQPRQRKSNHQIT